MDKNKNHHGNPDKINLESLDDLFKALYYYSNGISILYIILFNVIKQSLEKDPDLMILTEILNFVNFLEKFTIEVKKK